MMPLMRVLAKARILRGRWWDPLGRSAERRAERALIEEYRQLLDEFNQRLDVDNYDIAVRLASLPEQIRGYGSVKQAAIEKTAHERGRLLISLRSASKNLIYHAAG